MSGRTRAPLDGPGALVRVRHLGSGARLERPKPLIGPRPTVSVVVPCYNYGHFLPDAVASVLDQDGVDADVIIVDDASPDGSAAIAQGLASRDPRVRLVAHARNKGHIATYNDGLELVAGEFCVLMSADDRLAPGALQRAASLMRHHPEVGLVYGTAVDFVEVPPAVRGSMHAWALWSGAEWFEMRAKAGTNVIRSPEVVLRSSVQQAIGGYRQELPHSGDLEMWLRAASMAGIARIVGGAQAFYRVHAQNMHNAVFERLSARGMLVDLEQRRLAFEFGVQCARGRLADADRLGALARKTLATEALMLASRAYWWGHQGDWPVDALQQFATDVDPGSSHSPAARVLGRAVRFGRRRNVADELTDRLREDLAAARSRWAGI